MQTNFLLFHLVVVFLDSSRVTYREFFYTLLTNVLTTKIAIQFLKLKFLYFLPFLSKVKFTGQNILKYLETFLYTNKIVNQIFVTIVPTELIPNPT